MKIVQIEPSFKVMGQLEDPLSVYLARRLEVMVYMPNRGLAEIGMPLPALHLVQNQLIEVLRDVNVMYSDWFFLVS